MARKEREKNLQIVIVAKISGELFESAFFSRKAKTNCACHTEKRCRQMPGQSKRRLLRKKKEQIHQSKLQNCDSKLGKELSRQEQYTDEKSEAHC